mgnify:CR=1 FL=1
MINDTHSIHQSNLRYLRKKVAKAEADLEAIQDPHSVEWDAAFSLLEGFLDELAEAEYQAGHLHSQAIADLEDGNYLSITGCQVTRFLDPRTGTYGFNQADGTPIKNPAFRIAWDATVKVPEGVFRIIARGNPGIQVRKFQAGDDPVYFVTVEQGKVRDLVEEFRPIF